VLTVELLDSRRRLQHSLTMTIDKQSSGGAEASPIVFRLDPGSGVPTYLQLVQQVEHALRLGYLGVGDRLPKVKEVVQGLAINPNTVLKAYRDLERKGLSVGRPGQGTFVAGTLGGRSRDQDGLLRELLGWMRTAEDGGLDEESMVALFTSALHEFRTGSATGAVAR